MASSPYPRPFIGLRPFRTDEAALFYGREEQVDAMLARLEDRRFLAIVGSSGCGKSSLVRAGLIPALCDGMLTGAEGPWTVIAFQPGDDPIGNMARGFDQAATGTDRPKPALQYLEAALRSSPSGCYEALRLLGLNKPHAPVLLLIDQFEELFRFQASAGASRLSVLPVEKPPVDWSLRIISKAIRTVFRLTSSFIVRTVLGLGKAEDYVIRTLAQLANDRIQTQVQLEETSVVDGRETTAREDAARFTDLILSAARNPDSGIVVVLTIRSDFIGRCDAFHGLAEQVSESQFLVPRLTRRQMQEAIEGPLLLFGASGEPALVNQVLNAAGTDPDQLPLLQHTLMRAWDHALQRSGTDRPELLLLRDYLAVGGLEEALARDAEAAWNESSSLSPGVVEMLFRSLSKVEPDGPIVRRVTTVEEVAKIARAPEGDVIRAVQIFQDKDRAFIAHTPRGEITRESRLDLSHEALLRQWPRLRGWVQQESRAADQVRFLADRAAAWFADLGYRGLLGRPDLERALEWRSQFGDASLWTDRYRPRWHPFVLAYIAVSAFWNRLFRTVVFFLIGVVAIALGLLGFENYRTAQHNARLLEETKEQQLSTERLLAESWARAIGVGNSLSAPEFEVLWDLAAVPLEETRVRSLFWSNMLATPDALSRLSARMPEVVYSTVGLREDSAAEITGLLVKRYTDSTADERGILRSILSDWLRLSPASNHRPILSLVQQAEPSAARQFSQRLLSGVSSEHSEVLGRNVQTLFDLAVGQSDPVRAEAILDGMDFSLGNVTTPYASAMVSRCLQLFPGETNEVLRMAYLRVVRSIISGDRPDAAEAAARLVATRARDETTAESRATWYATMEVTSAHLHPRIAYVVLGAFEVEASLEGQKILARTLKRLGTNAPIEQVTPLSEGLWRQWQREELDPEVRANLAGALFRSSLINTNAATWAIEALTKEFQSHLDPEVAVNLADCALRAPEPVATQIGRFLLNTLQTTEAAAPRIAPDAARAAQASDAETVSAIANALLDGWRRSARGSVERQRYQFALESIIQTRPDAATLAALSYLNVILAEERSEDLLSLSASISSRSQSALADALVLRVLGYFGSTADRIGLGSLGRGLPDPWREGVVRFLIRCAGVARSEVALRAITEVFRACRAEPDLLERFDVSEELGDLLTHLEGTDLNQALDELLAGMTAATGVEELRDGFSRVLSVTARRIRQDQVDALYAKLRSALSKEGSNPGYSGLLDALGILITQADRAQANSVFDLLRQRFDEQPDESPEVRSALVFALTRAAVKADMTRSLALIELLPTLGDPFLQGNVLFVIAARAADDPAEAVARLFHEYRRLPDGSLENTLLSIAEEAEPGNASRLTDILSRAFVENTEPSLRAAIARALAATVTNANAESAERAFDAMVDVFLQTPTFETSTALAAAAGKLTPPVADRVAVPLLIWFWGSPPRADRNLAFRPLLRLGAVVSNARARRCIQPVLVTRQGRTWLSRAEELMDQRLSSALAEVAARLSAEELLEILKYPTVPDEARKIFLKALERIANHPFRDGLWSAVDWARRQGMPVETPPTRPLNSNSE